MAKQEIRENDTKNSIVIDLSKKKAEELKNLIHTNWVDADAGRSLWKLDKEERLALYWGMLRPKNFPFVNCLSKDTEILTKRGWVNIQDVTLTDWVLTRKDDMEELEWNIVEATPSMYAENLLHFESNSMDILVTPEHEMIVRNQQGKVSRMLAKDLFKLSGYRIPLSGKLNTVSPSKLFNLDAKKVAEFVGWYLAEGSSQNKGTLRISQSRTANQEKCKRIENLLNNLKFTWSYSGHDYLVHISSMPRVLVDILHEQGICDKKYVPRLFFDLGKDVAQSLLDGLILGDGCREIYNGYVSETFYSTSKQLSDDVQVLALYCGKRATIIPREPGGESEIRGSVCISKRSGYAMRICSRSWAKVDAAVKSIVKYNDMAFCVTVKNHSIYIRRNGIPSWTGNCANLHVPLMRTIKDTLHSNLMASIDDKKPVSVMPVGPEDAPKAKRVEKLLNWQLSTQVDYFDLVDKIIDCSLVFGHCPVKVRYVKETGDKEFDGIKIDVIPVERFLMPPDAIDTDVDTWEYCLQEIPVTKSDLKKRINAYGISRDDLDVDKIVPSSSTSKNFTEDALKNIRDLYSGVDGNKTPLVKSSYFTLLEWYGYFDDDEDGIDKSIKAVYLLETKTLLYCSEWKTKRPFSIIRPIPILNKSVGESVPDLLFRINQEINTLHNQRVDAVTFKNIPFGFFDPMSGVNPENVHLSPGVMIPVNGSPSQAVYFPPVNTASFEMFREEEFLLTMAERLLGAGANVQGAISPKRISATEVASIDRRSGIRFLTIFLRLLKGLKELFDLILYFNQKLLPPEVKIRVIGFDASVSFDSLSKEDISGNFDIIVNGNSIVDDAQEKAGQMAVYQLALLNPLIARDETALYEVTKDTFDKLGAKRRASYLRRPEDTIPKLPDEEHNLFAQEEYVKPNLNENVEQHLGAHADLINSPKFKLLSKKGQLLLMKHYNETVKMKTSLEQLDKINRLMQINSMIQHVNLTDQVPGVSQGVVGGNKPQGREELFNQSNTEES